MTAPALPPLVTEEDVELVAAIIVDVSSGRVSWQDAQNAGRAAILALSPLLTKIAMAAQKK